MSGYQKDKLVELIDMEYERTSKFIDGVTSTTATIRGWAVTIWLAVLGVAFSQSLWELGLLAIVVALVFYVIDGYHAWLYGEALARANDLERITAANYDSYGRSAGDAEADTDLRVRLEAHRFGLYRNFKQFVPRDLWYVRPTVFFRLFYPLLVVGGIAAALFLGLGRTHSSPSCNVIQGSVPQAIQCGNTIIVGGKKIGLAEDPSAGKRQLPDSPATTGP
jgi:hypothetical protein